MTLPTWTPTGPLPEVARFGSGEDHCRCKGRGGNDPWNLTCRNCEAVSDALDGYEHELAQPPCPCWWFGAFLHGGHCCFRPGRGAPSWVDQLLEDARERGELPYCHDEDDGDRRAREITAARRTSD